MKTELALVLWEASLSTVFKCSYSVNSLTVMVNDMKDSHRTVCKGHMQVCVCVRVWETHFLKLRSLADILCKNCELEVRRD